MSRQPRIDTSVRQQHAYSYVETPIELNPSGVQFQQQFPETIPGHGAAIHEPQLPNTSTPQPLQTYQQDPQNVATQELEQARQMLIQERQAFSPSGTPLPQHPALSAPYVEGNVSATVQRTSTPANSSSQYPSYQSPPYSPGSLPEKKQTLPFEPAPIHTTPITPDTNPLQSPISTIHRMGTFTSANQDSQPGHDSFTTHQPGQIAHPNQIVNGGNWSTGLCECTDVGTCCLGLACPCMLYGRTQYRLLRKSRGEDPTNLLGYETCNGSCTSLAVLCGCQWILATIQHTRTRKAYNIEGNICSDCVRATCCMCCTFIRNEREIKRREDRRAYTAQLTGSTFVTPYLPPGQMQYQSAHS